MKKISFTPLSLSLLLVFFAWTPAASAATLSFSAPAEVAMGELFSLNILVDSNDRGFNAAEAAILFPSDILEVISVDTVPSSTVFNFWLSVPSFSNEKGVISFSGGTTQGVVSSSAQILSLHVRAKGSGEALITASDASINASDGSGSNILDSIQAFRIVVSKARVVIPAPEPVPTPAPESPPASQLSVQESPVLPTKKDPCLGFFTNCEFPFPTIRTVSITKNRELGSNIFVAGSAIEGANVRLRLYRSNVLYKEIVTIVNPEQKWEGVLSNIPAYGVYTVEAVAESGNRASQPATWHDIRIAPPYTVYLFGSFIHWYTIAGTLLGLILGAFAAVLGYRLFFLHQQIRLRSTAVLAATAFCIALTIALVWLYVMRSGVSTPQTLYWKNTDIPCIDRVHSDESTYSSAKISLRVNEVLQGIPTEIGISPQCVAQVHTHDDIGYLHFEQLPQNPVTLGSFFTVAGEPLEREGYELSVTINGKDHADTAGTYALQNGDVIVVTYTSISVEDR